MCPHKELPPKGISSAILHEAAVVSSRPWDTLGSATGKESLGSSASIINSLMAKAGSHIHTHRAKPTVTACTTLSNLTLCLGMLNAARPQHVGSTSRLLGSFGPWGCRSSGFPHTPLRPKQWPWLTA